MPKRGRLRSQSAWKSLSTMLGRLALAGCIAAGMVMPAVAATGGYIVFDVASGEIFARHNADQAWYPASITKLMTTYVVFQMIKQGKLTFNSPVVVSAMAASQPPSKMGFPVGTVLTVDNALKMIMVKSANDIAWALGESVGGSREGFVALMNQYAHQIGMTETVWDNPNGLPDPNNMTTAHDMGLLARALLRQFPDYDFYFKLPGIQLGNRVIANHNHLMDHYPGADGMKTGYICASGYNVVATATRNGHRMVAVILGSRGARPRAELAAELFNLAFEKVGTSNLFSFASQTETLDNYRPGPEASQPVGDIHAEVCGGKRDTGSEEAIDDTADAAAPTADHGRGGSVAPAQAKLAHAEYLSPHFYIGPPVKVWLGGAESAATHAASLVTSPAEVAAPPRVAPASAPPAPAVTAAPRKRAPGAILPLPQQPAEATAEPSAPLPASAPVSADAPPEVAEQPAPTTQTPPAQETPLTRAFTLFQPQPAAAPPTPAASEAAAVRQPVEMPSADPAADATALKVPVPKGRPAEHQASAEATPVARTTHLHKTPKPAKVEKAKTVPPQT